VSLAVSPRGTSFAALALVGIGVSLALPAFVLPSLSLLLWVILPTPYLAVPQLFGRYVTPSVALLGVWALRTLASRRSAATSRTAWCLGGALVAWLILRLQASIEPSRSVAWTAVIVLAVVLVTIASPVADPRTGSALLRSWTAIAVVLGCGGILEGLTHQNPLASHFQVNGVHIGQTWSVYRIETTVGHPLLNGLFFATTTALVVLLCVAQFSWFRLLGAGAGALALVYTASRSALLGFGLGIGAALVLVVVSSPLPLGRKVVYTLALAVAVAGLAHAPVLEHRNRSAEAQSSSQYRQEVVSASLTEMRRLGYIGSGAGTSQTLRLRDGENPALENSVLQLGVSIGLPGLVAFSAVLALVSVAALRRARFYVIAGLVAFATASAGYNVWDSNPSAFAVLGLLAVLALCPGGAAGESVLRRVT
jgi:hypothetical protein